MASFPDGDIRKDSVLNFIANSVTNMTGDLGQSP